MQVPSPTGPTQWGRDLGSAWLEAHDKKSKTGLRLRHHFRYHPPLVSYYSPLGMQLYFGSWFFFSLSSLEHHYGPNSIVDRISTHLVSLHDAVFLACAGMLLSSVAPAYLCGVTAQGKYFDTQGVIHSGYEPPPFVRFQLLLFPPRKKSSESL